MPSEQKAKFTVVKAVPESDDVVTLYVRPDANEKFKLRRAGQFASLKVKREEGWSEPHPFTISAGPEEDDLRFTIKYAGDFTSRIKDLVPGASVECAGPFGEFCKDIDQQEDIVMLAGGVGITPFLSVLRHFAQTGAKNRVCLFWANKTFRDAFAAQELSELAGKLNLRVMHVLSRQKELPESRPENSSLVLGRIRAELIKDCLVSPTTSFYICGPAPMQEQMLKELASLGVDPARIQKELFGYRPKA